MTNLKFIEDQIEILEQCLMINKSHGTLKYKLKYLQKIKTELEAWEIVKHRLKKGNSIMIMDSIPITHPGYRTIEKVLEANNNGKL